MKLLGPILAAAAMLTASAASAQDVVIRSDLPLWRSDEPTVWPQEVVEDGEERCHYDGPNFYQRRMASGVIDEVRFSFTDFLGCVFSASASPYQNAWADLGLAFLIDLGIDDPARNGRLWAAQFGLRGGSEYWLLSRLESGDFEILDPECPPEFVRRAPAETQFRTDYCAVPDREALIRLAQAAVTRPSAGVLTSDY